MEKQSRRGILKNAAAAAAGITGAAALVPQAQAQSGIVWQKKAVQRAPVATPPAGKTAGAAGTAPAAPAGPALYNGIVTFGNLVFLSGIGAHFPGTIEEHTKHVLDELEQNLIRAGSSLEKVLKVNVYLNDLADYAKMNATYAGRWGAVPPVRTTIAAAGGIPGNSLVEIDCIASI